MTNLSLQSCLRVAALAACMAAGATLVAGDAHAQDAAKPAPSKKPAKKGKKKGGDNDGMGPFKKKDYPLSERLRLLVLPDGMGEVGVDLPIFRTIDLTDGDSTVGLGLVPSFAYGLGDMVELGISTGFPLAPDADWNRTLVPRVAFLAYDSKEFDFAPGISIPLAFVDETAIGVNIDLTSRYVLSEGWFIYFGQGAIPLGVSPDFTLSVVANGGVGWQVNKATLLFGELNPFTLVLAPDATATGIWDYLNLALGGQYSPSRNVDVGARLGLVNLWGVDNSLFWTITPYGRFRF